MKESPLALLEHRRAEASLRLDRCRDDAVGALAELQDGLNMVTRVQKIGRVLPMIAGSAACVVAGIGGYWLLTRAPSRPRWWQAALFAWRFWSFWKEAGQA